MKQLTKLHVLAAVVASVTPLSFVRATDLLPAATTGEFQRIGKGPQAHETYQEPLYKDFTIYDIPRAVANLGAYGPIREEVNPQNNAARTADEQFWHSLYPIGGQNTP